MGVAWFQSLSVTVMQEEFFSSIFQWNVKHVSGSLAGSEVRRARAPIICHAKKAVVLAQGGAR